MRDHFLKKRRKEAEEKKKEEGGKNEKRPLLFNKFKIRFFGYKMNWFQHGTLPLNRNFARFSFANPGNHKQPRKHDCRKH